MESKTDKAMEALKNRGSLKSSGGKKGFSMLHIVEKLTNKRTAKQDKPDGAGGPGFKKFIKEKEEKGEKEDKKESKSKEASEEKGE